MLVCHYCIAFSSVHFRNLTFAHCCSQRHTHPFNSPLSRTTWVSRYQKGKTNLDFTEAGDSEWQSAPRCRQITTPAPHHSVFYRPDALPAAQPTASKHWRVIAKECTWKVLLLYYLGYLLRWLVPAFSALICLQCFDAVGWAAGRASGL